MSGKRQRQANKALEILKKVRRRKHTGHVRGAHNVTMSEGDGDLKMVKTFQNNRQKCSTSGWADGSRSPMDVGTAELLLLRLALSTTAEHFQLRVGVLTE